MTKEKELTPVEQKEVDFYGDELSAVRMQNGRIYVSIRHMCDALGIDRRGQVRQIKKHDILNEGYTRGDLSHPLRQMGGVGASNKRACYELTSCRYGCLG